MHRPNCAICYDSPVSLKAMRVKRCGTETRCLSADWHPLKPRLQKHWPAVNLFAGDDVRLSSCCEKLHRLIDAYYAAAESRRAN